MSESPALLVEHDGPVAILTMNRPEAKNAINPEMLCRFADAWDLVDGDDDVRAAILTGAGGAYCAGADLDRLVMVMMGVKPPEDEYEERCKDDLSIVYKGLLRDHYVATPLIAAIEGPCIAGGVEMLQATDIRVAAEGSTFGISEVRWGLFPMGGSTVRLRRQIPYTWAMEMLLTGDHYPAEDALRMGLVGRVVPKGQALAEARTIAERIAANGPLAVRRVKEAVLATDALPEKEAFEIDMRLGLEVSMSDDAREGPRAFKEKRPPQFKGR
jgi:enoyl-CoA hydratase